MKPTFFHSGDTVRVSNIRVWGGPGLLGREGVVIGPACDGTGSYLVFLPPAQGMGELTVQMHQSEIVMVREET